MSRALPFEILEMQQKFESLKVCIGSNEPVDENVEVTLPDEIIEQVQNGELKLSNERSQGFSITRRKRVALKSQYVRNILFKETCDQIFVIIRRVLDQTNLGIKTVVLVGGFAESKIVQEHVRTKINDSFPEVNVFVPTSPFQAVLKGAVLFGHNLQIFRSRIMRKTYGVATNALFDRKVHDPSKKWLNKDDNKSYCKHIFDIHVRRGDSVKLLEKQPSKSYTPLHRKQKVMSIPLYEYPDRAGTDIMYITDPKCKQIGSIKVDIKDNPEGRDRTVTVTMIYGGTQLSVIAVDESTKLEINSNIEFNQTSTG